ncbi:uncharacterized protein BDZ99DRAFT_495965 [Mytilinidion resinicola]|uniref:Uncharacterized protein n=1 Tax=Mytilinidion resinicola TaxID=574789 RepID=A0A6A6YV02_9PEZI|nr:uncharacterized protein BDZ99DRAFT_495965 [Mytilinidion resinicola]KAF2812786.1 hypothetical protein BDZ99DRAFT_495965 [Mytilinidion resinicola]
MSRSVTAITGVTVYISRNGHGNEASFRIFGGIRILTQFRDWFTSSGIGPHVTKAFYSNLKPVIRGAARAIDAGTLVTGFQGLYKDTNQLLYGVVSLPPAPAYDDMAAWWAVVNPIKTAISIYVAENVHTNVVFVIVDDAFIAGGGAVTSTKRSISTRVPAEFMRRQAPDVCGGYDLVSLFSNDVVYDDSSPVHLA